MARVATIVKGYPRLSETFIAQEILGLEDRGVEQLIVSLRHPTDPAIHNLHREISADVLYLPEYLKDDPRRVRRAYSWAKSQDTYQRTHAIFERDYARDQSVNRQRRWGQACVFAHEMPDDIAHLHTHFLHTPASVTRYAALLKGMTWSYSAHAKDIWTSEKWDLEEKLIDAAWGVTCTQFNTDYLKSLARDPSRVSLVYHGLDFERFKPFGPRENAKSGDAGDPVEIISVGRAVDKKGYPDLIDALAGLDGLNWRFTHIGGGKTGPLKERATRRGIGDRCQWLGALSRDDVVRQVRNSDIFVLASRVTKDGDRDGIPNVLMEAQALGIVCLSTHVSAIPELIDHNVNGILVGERNAVELRTALQGLITDPKRRFDLASIAFERVTADFSCVGGIDDLARRFQPYLDN